MHGFVVALIALAALDATAQVNRCVDKTGKVTYQQRACDNAPIAVPATEPVAAAAPTAPDPGRVKTASPPASARAAGSPSNRPPAAAASAADDVQVRDVAYQIGLREWCDANVPGFRQQYGLPYHDWRVRHAGMVRKIETGATYAEPRSEGRAYMAEKFDPKQPEARSFCAGLASVLLAR
jgi:hypothetical protein